MTPKTLTYAFIGLCLTLTTFLLNYSECVSDGAVDVSATTCEDHIVRPKVNVTLFYESMCPYSKAFITTQLYPTYTKLQEYLSVTVVPFGNGNINERTLRSKKTYYSVTCQHGQNECKGNTIQACAVKYCQTTEAWLSLIACMSVFYDPYNQGKKCADKLNLTLEWSLVTECVTKEGEQILLEMGRRTQKQIPHVTHVPYVVIGSAYDRLSETQAVKNLFQLACSMLGEHKPPICKAE
ncbi:gamma-interferon-inducible lysosomal thiol reductase [Ixodes scapularis]|uniref:gamma-interferon-inducible lysosomal thiol reductase n=1 Tax=Ixodes scapularis TaxID=6945 RepID=UPI001A9EA628|nr:gamma-interferon-inducible lysosomal thiol reductase [Ixodes scapularis]